MTKPKQNYRELADAPVILGEEYRDNITGFQGTATGHVNYISGCDQTLLAPRAKEDGSLVSGVWFDDDRLVHAESGNPIDIKGPTTGADMPAPVRS